MKKAGKLFGFLCVLSFSFMFLSTIGLKKSVAAEELEEVGDVQEAQEERKLRRDLSPTMFDKWGAVDENIIFDPSNVTPLKELLDRGSFEPSDFLGDDDEEQESLVEMEIEMDPNNPIYLSGSGRLAGTGDVRVALASEAAKVGLSEHPKALEVAGLSLDEFGLVNWADAIRKGKISPLAGLTDGKRAGENYEEYIIIFKTMSDYMPDVVFPHDIHTYWLDCSNCHKKIFNPKAGSNPVTMKKIVAGQYCGRCHGKVAFPLEECTRCHIKPKGGGGFVTYPLFNEFQMGYGFNKK